MADQLKSIIQYTADGSTTAWEVTFAGGYLSRDHVQAMTFADEDLNDPKDVSLTFINEGTISISPPVEAGRIIRIYRNTPVDRPLVDFSDGSVINEKSLDRNAEQAIFGLAELQDRYVSSYDVDRLGELVNSAARSAALAEAVGGPSYEDTASGLADTSDGDLFAVVSDGIVTIWLNDDGVAVEQRTLATTEALASSEGAGLIGSTDGLTVQQEFDKLNSSRVYLSSYPVVGDGATNDYDAIVEAYNKAMALNAEFYIDKVGDGNYFIGTNELVFNTPGQVITAAPGVEIRGNGAPDSGAIVTFAKLGGTVQPEPSDIHPSNTRCTGLRVRSVAPFSEVGNRAALRISCSFSLFTDCSVTTSADNGGFGIALEGDNRGNGPYYNTFIDCNIQGAQNGEATGTGWDFRVRSGTGPTMRYPNTCTILGGRTGGYARQVDFRGGGHRFVGHANENYPSFGTAYYWSAPTTVANLQNVVINPYIENAEYGFVIEAGAAGPLVIPGKSTGVTTLISDVGQRCNFLGYDGVRSLRLSAQPTPSANNRGGAFIGNCNNTDPLTLDWYEEGTWTPTLVGSTTAGSYSISVADAGFQRVGNRVKCWARLTITVSGAGSGVAFFGGLPYPKGASRILNGVASTSGVALDAATKALTIEQTSTGVTSNFLIRQIRDNTTPVNLDVAALSTNDVIQVQFEYSV